MFPCGAGTGPEEPPQEDGASGSLEEALVKTERVLSRLKGDNYLCLHNFLRKRKSSAGFRPGACRFLGLLEETPPAEKEKIITCVLAQRAKRNQAS